MGGGLVILQVYLYQKSVLRIHIIFSRNDIVRLGLFLFQLVIFKMNAKLQGLLLAVVLLASVIGHSECFMKSKIGKKRFSNRQVSLSRSPERYSPVQAI